MTLTLAGLASCAGPSDPVGPLSPDPSVTPVFASDEEALAAAEEAYGRYLDVTNKIGRSGWRETERLTDVSRAGALDGYLQAANDFAEKGYFQTGSSTFDSAVLQQWRTSDTTVVTVYLCVDFSDVDVLDKNDQSVVDPSRPERQGREVDVDDVDGDWKVSRSEEWSGNDFC